MTSDGPWCARVLERLTRTQLLAIKEEVSLASKAACAGPKKESLPMHTDEHTPDEAERPTDGLATRVTVRRLGMKIRHGAYSCNERGCCTAQRTLS